MTAYCSYTTYGYSASGRLVYDPDGGKEGKGEIYPEYHHRDHLGNTRVAFTDRNDDEKVEVLGPNNEVVQQLDYYPFGMAHDVACLFEVGSGDNRYRYNGKELVEEIGLYDYGARWYDPSIGRWNAVDPLAEDYTSISPYAYVANTPVNAIDPDGQKILFVNGHWQSGWRGGLIGSDSPGKGYWGKGFTRAAQRFFNDYSTITKDNYIDGSSSWGGDESGGQRKRRGYRYAKKNYETLIDGLAEDESFKLVTHSEGGAFGAGIAKYLLEQGHNVETVLHLSPDEGDEFNTPRYTMTYELSYSGDWVTGNTPIGRGVDVRGIVEKFTSTTDRAQYSHGSTKGKGVFKEVEALLRQALQGANQVNVTETASGVTFELVRDNRNQQ